MFLHSCRTPQRVVNALSRMGLSVAQRTIHSAINSLSSNASLTLKKLGETHCVALAYDNFDVDLKTSVPVVEKSGGDSLKHLMSGLAFPLQHGVTKEDLRFSDYLWQKFKSNLDSGGNSTGKKTYNDLALLFMEEPESDGEPDVHEEFNTWIYLRDLIENIEGFEYLHGKLNQPRVIEQIPVEKTDIYPVYAMDVNNSTVSGNIQAIQSLMSQVGYGSPDDETSIDISDYIVVVHGDLATGERINSIMHRRSLEYRPWERFQYVKFCPGYFHVKMACAEALWRIAIKPELGRRDETCFMKDIAILRPKETGTIISKCEFRQMHQLIKHVGIARRLDCWRIAVSRRYPQFRTLEEFAKSKPKLEDLEAIARELVDEYVASYELSSQLERIRPKQERDQQFENAATIQQYLLLYEELSHSMNVGDIGRLERTVLSWIPIFKATGKHKYATAMEKFLVEIHFECPVQLRHAIQYNMLVNPTGKPGKFRAVDWVVEGNNCEIKVHHGGQGSTRTVKRMISESALIGTYKLINESMENNLLVYTTTAHGEPDMSRTLSELRKILSHRSPHIFVSGRKSMYCIPDMLNNGVELLDNKSAPVRGEGDDNLGDALDLRPSLDDIVVELL